MADSITCPQCGKTSHNRNDVQTGYCANCGGVTQKGEGDHLPWTPWSIWHSADLPDMAFERLAAGGIWRIQEPRVDPFQFEVDPGKVYSNRETVRIAVYRAVADRSQFGRATILGQWEGDKDWVEVGWIEGG